MRHQRVTLVVYGMHTYLGREVARFGRAMGHRVVGVVDGPIPEFDQPWMHGIEWNDTSDPLTPPWPDGPPAAVLYCDTTLYGQRRRFERILVDRPTQLIETVQQLTPTPCFVLRSTIDQPLLPSGYTAGCRRAEQRLANADIDSAVLRLPLIYGPDRPDSVAAMMIAESLSRLPVISDGLHNPVSLRVETAALAALRAGLEPDVSGLLSPDDIAQLGDVMIPQ